MDEVGWIWFWLGMLVLVGLCGGCARSVQAQGDQGEVWWTVTCWRPWEADRIMALKLSGVVLRDGGLEGYTPQGARMFVLGECMANELLGEP